MTKQYSVTHTEAEWKKMVWAHANDVVSAALKAL